MIRFRNPLFEMRTWELPPEAGLPRIKQETGVIRRSLGSAAETGKGVPVDVRHEVLQRSFPPSFTLTAAGTKGDIYPPLTEKGFPDELATVEPFKSAVKARKLVLISIPTPVETSSVADLPLEEVPTKATVKSNRSRPAGSGAGQE